MADVEVPDSQVECPLQDTQIAEVVDCDSPSHSGSGRICKTAIAPHEPHNTPAVLVWSDLTVTTRRGEKVLLNKVRRDSCCVDYTCFFCWSFWHASLEVLHVTYFLLSFFWQWKVTLWHDLTWFHAILLMVLIFYLGCILSFPITLTETYFSCNLLFCLLPDQGEDHRRFLEVR